MNDKQLSALMKAAQVALDECKREEVDWYSELTILQEDFHVSEADAHFIALADPEYIIWLIDEILRQRASG